jgi:hypothetical protein
MRIKRDGHAVPDAKRRPESLTIRKAGTVDEESLIRLAGLDSKHVPPGTFLIAEVDGEDRAAVAIESGEVLADPFHHTADIAEMLQVRASRLREIEHPVPARKRGLADVAARLIPGQRRRSATAAARN